MATTKTKTKINKTDCKFTNNIPRMVAFDFETTGLDCKTERVVEFGYILVENGEEVKKDSFRMNPEQPIGAQASKVNGICDDDVKGCPTFRDKLEIFEKLFTEDTVYVGYNVQFDLKFLREEFKRAGVKNFSWSKNVILDPMELWKNTVSGKRLVDAFKVFVGGELKDAHSALADISATVDVLDSMVDKFHLEKTVSSVASACFPKPNINKVKDEDKLVNSDKFIWNDKGKVLINFGKYRGKELSDITKSDIDYLEYLLRQNFPQDEAKLMEMAVSGKKLPTKK